MNVTNAPVRMIKVEWVISPEMMLSNPIAVNHHDNAEAYNLSIQEMGAGQCKRINIKMPANTARELAIVKRI